jgi:hypothetical protein
MVCQGLLREVRSCKLLSRGDTQPTVTHRGRNLKVAEGFPSRNNDVNQITTRVFANLETQSLS